MAGKTISVFYMKEILELETKHLIFLRNSRDRVLKNLVLIENQIDIFEDEVDYIVDYLDKFDESEDEDE